MILADFADVVIGEASFVQIVAGTQTTYKDASNNVISAFSADHTVVRIISQHDLGMRHQESVAVLTGVSWIPSARVTQHDHETDEYYRRPGAVV